MKRARRELLLRLLTFAAALAVPACSYHYRIDDRDNVHNKGGKGDKRKKGGS